MANCVVCNKSGWTHSKVHSHKICLDCGREGYRFGKIVPPSKWGGLGWVEVLNVDSVHVKDLRVRV